MLALSGLFVLLPGTAQAQTAEPPSFPDVAASNPAHDAIVYLAGAKVISGFANGTFGPDQVLKRGQATKILVSWQEVPLATTSTGSSHFNDVDSSYQPYVDAAAAKGWIGGYPDGTFRPYNQLTREQMALVLIRSMGLEDAANALSSSQISLALAPFADSSAISASARPSMALAITRGLFSGDGTRLNPTSGITRAQFSMVVLRAELAGLAIPQSVSFDSSYPDKTRVVIDLSRAPGAVTAGMAASGILTVDCAGGAIAGTLAKSVGSTEVKTVTAEIKKNGKDFFQSMRKRRMGSVASHPQNEYIK